MGSDHLFPVASLGFVVLWSLLGMWAFEWWNTHDGADTPFRLAAFMHELRGGHFPVRWTSLFSGGHGSPFFVFYAPGLMCPAAVFDLLGFGVLDSVKLATLLARLVGVFAICALGARRFGAMGGYCAGLAFALAPYLNGDLFVRGAFSEHMAINLIALLLLWADRALVTGRLRHLFLAGAAFAAVIFTHNISGMLAAPALLVWGLVLAALHLRPRLLLRTGLILLLGIGLAAFFWLPALALRGEVRIAEMFVDTLSWGDWDYMCDFEKLWSRFRDVGGKPLTRNLSFAPGDWQVLAAVISLGVASAALLLKKGIWCRISESGTSPFPLQVPGSESRHHARGWNRRLSERPAAWVRFARLVAPAVVVVGGVFFFVTADWLPWVRLPLLHTMQFPYRVLIVMVPMLCLVVAGLGRLFPRSACRSWPLFLLTSLLATSASLYPGPQSQMQFALADGLHSVTSHRVERLLLRTHQTGNAVNEYLPLTVDFASAVTDSMASAEPSVLPPTSGRVESVEEGRRACVVELTEAADLRFSVYFFPSWRATIDGERVAVGPDADGLILLRCPPGRHEVRLRYGRTRSEWVGLLISLVTLAAGGVAFAVKRVGLLSV